MNREQEFNLGYSGIVTVKLSRRRRINAAHFNILREDPKIFNLKVEPKDVLIVGFLTNPMPALQGFAVGESIVHV